MIVIGFDSSLNSFGWVVGEVSTHLHIFEGGCWRTKPGKHKKKTDDVRERCAYLARQVDSLLAEWQPGCVVVESLAMPFGKSRSSTFSALGRVRGVVDALTAVRDIALREVSPQKLKREATGSVKAEKADVIKAMADRYPQLLMSCLPGETQAEHVYDAAAALHAWWQTEGR